ncbi:MAG: thiamine phosphate synthase [Betaproteobacteria bacterium]
MAQAQNPARRIRQLQGLYAVTPDIVDISQLVAKVEAAIAGGAQAIQYRNKTGSPSLRAKQAAMLARVCGGRGALFIVNDDVALAREVGAAGVHLGEDDGDVGRARERLGKDMIIGVSCYNDIARAKRLVAEGADYIAFGSFYPSQTKPEAARAELTLLRRARALKVPVVAIGGITATNAHALVMAGADALAVISAVFNHDDLSDVTKAAAAIVACFDHDPDPVSKSTTS